MNSKLRDEPTLRDWLTLLQTNHDKSIDEQVANIDAAEKAIRQAVGEEILELIEIDYEAEYLKNHPCDVCGDMQYSHAPDTHKEAGVREFKAELRQKIKEWQG